MNAEIKVLDTLLAVALQLSKSPDSGIRLAATNQITQLSRCRSKLLKDGGKEGVTGGAQGDLVMQG